jgi:hypothetical protein
MASRVEKANMTPNLEDQERKGGDSILAIVQLRVSENA